MKWPWLGCSRGRPPRIVLKPRRPKAVRAFARFLTADVADIADEETAAGLSELPVLLFQALGFVMLSRIAPRGGNHGWTRIHTDELGGAGGGRSVRRSEGSALGYIALVS